MDTVEAEFNVPGTVAPLSTSAITPAYAVREIISIRTACRFDNISRTYVEDRT